MHELEYWLCDLAKMLSSEWISYSDLRENTAWHTSPFTKDRIRATHLTDLLIQAHRDDHEHR